MYWKQFTIDVAKYFGVFIVSSVVISLIYMIFGNTFPEAWRNVHDHILVWIFWDIAPAYGIVLLVDYWLGKESKLHKYLQKIPQVVHLLAFTLLIATLGSLISQAFGGCLWFYITEGWWSIFVPPLLINSTIARIFYIAMSAVTILILYYYWKRFIRVQGFDIQGKV